MGDVSLGLAYYCRKQREERADPPGCPEVPTGSTELCFGCLVFGPKVTLSEAA